MAFLPRGAWRSVGSPPPDVAVWGRPSYVLPVWRYVITTTTERILTGPVYGPTPPKRPRNHQPSGARNVRLHHNFDPGLVIPMAVTDARYRVAFEPEAGATYARYEHSFGGLGRCDQRVTDFFPERRRFVPSPG